MSVSAESPGLHPISSPDLIPVRMLNEYTYCPRLCFLEWIEQEWDENLFTLEGAYHL